MSRVHVAITHQAKPGKEAEYEAALRNFARESLHEPGTAGVLLLAPVPGTHGCEYGILRSFEDQSSCDAFYQSERFRQFHELTKPLVVEEATRRKLHGLEAFFRDPRTSPPRWKMAIITWLGVFPSVLFWGTLLPPYLTAIPSLMTVALTTMCVTITLAWVVMPMLTKVFAPLLHPPISHVSILDEDT
ncbi:antibiotic biosynthesis monooxygenase [Bremerella sp. T1]|uniref:antibiotic biosynthesis monooxygenase n=1 Tax=Bremerella sp. TYQ1 TaxID=3119568 RepID=UPI001CC93616|nr:antibiotic biosynthesis monooxygenase [Bremerella volcania]UBM38827.1 antibiotic biosynthesis monooxygenase [Bremerella volcania]